jgi:hypothetical protein
LISGHSRERIPYPPEQGNKSDEQGGKSGEQGIKSVEQGDMLRPGSLHQGMAGTAVFDYAGLKRLSPAAPLGVPSPA